MAQGIRTIAFPAISCGVYGYPVDPAAAIAVETTRKALENNPSIESVYFVCFEGDVWRAYERRLS